MRVLIFHSDSTYLHTSILFIHVHLLKELSSIVFFIIRENVVYLDSPSKYRFKIIERNGP